MRKVKVFVKIEGVIRQALKQVLGLIDVQFMETIEEADLIIVDSYNEVGRYYDKEKHFAIFSLSNADRALPENVRWIKMPNAVVEIFDLVVEINKKVGAKVETNEKKTAVKKVQDKLLPDAKKILVIEDTKKHQESAHQLLVGHHLVVVSGFEEAMKILSQEKFEVVLSDLKLPMSPNTLSSEAFELGKLVDYGLLIALEAARCGAKYVAVATDLNHHADCFAAAFDHFSRFEFNINGAKVKYMHAPMKNIGGEYAKDWQRILEIIVEKKGGVND